LPMIAAEFSNDKRLLIWTDIEKKVIIADSNCSVTGHIFDLMGFLKCINKM
jgi:hypothetical protein